MRHADCTSGWCEDCSRGPPPLQVTKGAFQLTLLREHWEERSTCSHGNLHSQEVLQGTCIYDFCPPTIVQSCLSNAAPVSDRGTFPSDFARMKHSLRQRWPGPLSLRTCHPAHLQAELTARRDKLQGERDFLKTTSANLLNNQQDWKDMLSAEKCKVIERDAEVASLKEQVTFHAAAEPATSCATCCRDPSPGSR